jgi:CheY-like chemotaxis protein
MASREDEQLRQFAHELRTPLAAMRVWSEVLRAGVDDPETRARALDAIDVSVECQAKLIEDLMGVLAGARTADKSTPPATPQPPVRRLDGLSILVVEDHRDTREGLVVLFQRFGARVVAAGTASAGYEALTAGPPPDLLICDLGLPDEDGIALMRRIRTLAGPVGQVRAVALTGRAEAQFADEALAAGFHQHLAKPLDLKRLLDVVASLGQG